MTGLYRTRQPAGTIPPPPKYEDCIAVPPFVPAGGKTGTGASKETMTKRLECLEAAQAVLTNNICEMQQQLQTHDQVRGRGRRCLRRCYTRVRSAFVGAKDNLPRKKRPLPYWQMVFVFGLLSKVFKLSARIFEFCIPRLSPEEREATAAEAAEARFRGHCAGRLARCMLDCLMSGGDIGSVTDRCLADYDEALAARFGGTPLRSR